MAHAENPVMLYSVGKDSAVMLHLARKAFYPSPPPFPLMHVDTRWKFQAMYDFRDIMAKESKMDLIVHTNPEGIEKNINPFDHGSALHTDIMKTQGLKQALDLHGFDVAFGGARRDEEKSRAKERIFSFRNSSHRWDPKEPKTRALESLQLSQVSRAKVFEYSRYPTGQNWISGNTSIVKASLSCHFTMQLSARWLNAMAC
jgi:sulfate adenylyltransferase subunit 2